MSKTIKVEEHVYDTIEKYRGKRETFSQAIERLLKVISKIDELSAMIRTDQR